MTGLRHKGFTYTEVLVATALLALALIPMLDSLKPGLQGAQIHREQAEIHFVLKGRLEQLLAERFDDLDAAGLAAGAATTPTSYSQAGAAMPHEVFIWRWDGDNADADDDGLSGGDADLLWLRVATMDGLTDLQTLMARP